jgi:hypothetical protein
MDQELNDEQKEYLKTAMEEGSTFEDMVKHNGWKMILANYQNQLRLFVNDLLLNDKPIEKYESKRRELMGLQKLITSIDNSIKVAQDERQKLEKSK